MKVPCTLLEGTGYLQRSWAGPILCLILWTVAIFSVSADELRLASPFRDGAVLQRDQPVPVWGWAKADQSISVTFGDQQKSTTCGPDGKWTVKLDPLPASARPGRLQVSAGEEESVEIENILVGEVWLCSGQSNMAMRVDLCKDADIEKAAADLPEIRVFAVTRKAAEKPAVVCEGEWITSSPESAGKFSATAFFFGRELHKKLDVPVGLIVPAWGGSAIEAWTSREAQENEPALAALRESWQEKDNAYTVEVEAAEKAAYEQKFAEWKKAVKASPDNRPRAPRRPINPRFHHHHPDVLFNGMIAPLIPYGIRGAIWYQGETNAFTEESSALYEKQLTLLVNDWRARWGQGDFSMAWVQLPFSSARQVAWARIRESMRRVNEALPNTGMAISIDLGEERLLHPKNKQGFAHRLALWARAEVYGEEIPWTGPLPAGVRVVDGKLTVNFKHTFGGLNSGSDDLSGFEIYTGDWKPAKAEISGDSVVVEQTGSAIRYSWANHPDGNLYNQAGLPASPFELSVPGVKVKKARVSKTPPPAKPPLEPADMTDLPEGIDSVDIFLLTGQSNMKGRGVMPEEPLRDPQILMMHKPTDQWFLARHPLHLVGNPETFKGHDNAGVGPGLAFGQAIAKARPNTRICLVPCAVGGTRIGLWAKGKPLYENAIRKAKLALGQGPAGKTRIAGVLWLQGESDSGTSERIDAYPGALSELVDNLRSDLGIPDLPFIATTIGELRADIDGRRKINAALLALPDHRPQTACVDGRDLVGHIGDLVHFDTATQNEIGKRFADLYLKLSN